MTTPRRAAPHDRGFLRQSAGSSLAALAAMLSGLLLDIVLAARFGAGRQSDAFFVAARIPIGLSALLMTVATQALVPVFSRDRRENGRSSLASFASRTTGAVVLGGLALCALAWVLAVPLVALTAPGMSASQRELAASMVPVMFLVVPLVAAAETTRAALNASYSFVGPAAMNLFMNGLAAALVLLGPRHEIRVVPWAYVAGAAFQLAVIAGLAWWRGMRIVPSWHIGDARVRAALSLTARPTLSSALNLGNRVVEQLVASFLPAGSITVLAYGQRLISALGGGVFFRPVTVALLPRLADAEHASDGRRVGRLVTRGLTLVLAISLPLTAFTVALAGPVVHLVFHRGSFGPLATRMLALSLVVYALSLAGSGVQRVLLAPFYARLDTRTPLRNAFYGVVVDLVLLLPCIALFGTDRVDGVLGVALAYSVTQYVIVAHAWIRLRRTAPLEPREVLGFATRAAIASSAAAVAMLVLVHVLDLAHAEGQPRLAAGCAFVGLVGVVVLVLAAVPLFGARRMRATVAQLRPGRRRGHPADSAQPAPREAIQGVTRGVTQGDGADPTTYGSSD